MSFRINTNVAALTAHMYSLNNNKSLDTSLSRLSSGLRINKAADDASGLAIANQLGAQANGLGQAIRNANDGINLAQTADGALGEYTKIINTVRTKAIQAASDGQNVDSRKAIQSDINKLLEEAQNIAKTTSFNGQNLLDGTFTNKSFHVGAYANQTVDISIGNVQTNTIGQHVNETAAASVNSNTGNSAAAAAFTTSTTINGTAVAVSAAATAASGDNLTAHSAGSAWAKAISINSIENTTGVHATADTTVTGSAVAGGTIAAGDLKINGIDIGAVTVGANDSDHSLMNAINSVSSQTNVTASLSAGKVVLTANDGSTIDLTTNNKSETKTGLGLTSSTTGGPAVNQYNTGSLTLSSGTAVTVTNGATGASGFGALSATTTYSVKNAVNSTDVTTRSKAEDAIMTMDFALKQVDSIRSNIGSTQNQLESTVRNISVTQVNVTAAESSIRDVDFAAESANFAKYNILAQSGSYAMSQANLVQKNVLRLLQ